MPDLRKNSLHVVTIDAYTSKGIGISHIGGRVTFIKGALKGERCKVKITKVLRNLIYARLMKVMTKSKVRREPECPVFGKCGGCDHMHMEYEAELDAKRHRVNTALRRIGGLNLRATDIVGSDQILRYRNKAVYSVKRDAEGLAVTGFYRARTHDVVPNENCFIQAEVSDRAAKAVREWMNLTGTKPYDEKKEDGVVRHIFCRYAFATGVAQVTIIVFKDELPRTDALIELVCRHCPETESIVINVNKNRGNVILYGEFYTLWGSDYIEDVLCGLKFKLSPRSFYQINGPQAEKLYAHAIEKADLKETDIALDLYCGTGTITLLLAKHCKKAIGIEIVDIAIEDARVNAALNEIENVEFICGDAFKASKIIQESGECPDVVLIDPPRKGLQPEVIDLLVEFAPRRIVYVSCNPATLARDVRLLNERGFSIREVTAFDMFPRCAHVESIALLTNDTYDPPASDTDTGCYEVTDDDTDNYVTEDTAI